VAAVGLLDTSMLYRFFKIHLPTVKRAEAALAAQGNAQFPSPNSPTSS
jgi:hypothetical protein